MFRLRVGMCRFESDLMLLWIGKPIGGGRCFENSQEFAAWVRFPFYPLYHHGLTGRALGLQNREVQVRVLRMVLGGG